MQYADVALPVKTKTHQDAFTYMIPPALLPDIQIGRRVLVPFAGRQLVGVVTGLRSQAPVTKKGLQQITKYVDPIPLFTASTLQLAKIVAQQHAASLGQVLAIAAPAPAPRTAKKLTLTEIQTEQNTKVKQQFAIFQPIQKRWQAYRTLIQRARKQEKNCLILFSNTEHAAGFQHYLAANQQAAILVPASTEKSQLYRVWLEAIAGQYQIVIGTRKAVFLPVPNLGLMIVDSPNEYGYKEEQYPYYQADQVAKEKAQLEGATLVFGDAVPSLAQWQQLRVGTLKLITQPSQSTPTTLIDTSTHKRLFPDALIEKIQATIEKQGTVGIYYNRKGEGRYYRCLECESAIYCQRCDNLLTVYTEDDKTILRCGHCGFETAPPYRCPICSSYKMGSVGLGVNSIAKILSQHFPEATIATLSKDQPIYHPTNQITICTSQLFFQPPAVHFDLLATIHIDQILHGTSYRTNEEAYLILSRLAERTDHLIIQSSQPDHPVIQAYCSDSLDHFYTTEAQLRKEAGYPPFGALTQLIFPGADEGKVKHEVYRLYGEIKMALPGVQLLEPTPVLGGKRRGRYRYQIIIRGALTKELAALIPPGWQIDPAPDSL